MKGGAPPPPTPKSKPINKRLGGGCSHNFNIPCSFSFHKTISDISQKYVFLFNRLTLACICNALRKYILTLGPHFYIFSVLSPRICFCFVNPYFLAGIAAFGEILLLAVSKHVLKRSKKARYFGPDRLFHEPLPPEGD